MLVDSKIARRSSKGRVSKDAGHSAIVETGLYKSRYALPSKIAVFYFFLLWALFPGRRPNPGKLTFSFLHYWFKMSKVLLNFAIRHELIN